MHNLHDLQTRHPTRNDLPAITSFANTIAQMDVGLESVTTLRDLQNLWDSPVVDLRRDMLLVLDGQGNIVGNCVALLMPPAPQVYQEINLHPIFRNRGLEEFLLERAEEHARANSKALLPDTPITIAHGVYEKQRWLQALLENNGYSLLRRVRDFRLEMQAPPPIPELAPSIKLRPYDPAKHLERVSAALREIQQHYNYSASSFSEIEFISLDPELVFIALEGRVVVAVVAADLNSADEARLVSVAARHQWASTGVLAAVLQTGLRTLYQQGVRSVRMTVSAPDHYPFTAALTAVGMQPRPHSLIYTKDLRVPAD